MDRTDDSEGNGLCISRRPHERTLIIHDKTTSYELEVSSIEGDSVRLTLRTPDGSEVEHCLTPTAARPMTIRRRGETLEIRVGRPQPSRVKLWFKGPRSFEVERPDSPEKPLGEPCQSHSTRIQ
ncbi:MAG: hypothetical protein JWN86_1084 [Planctomycetota bacterium]|nr:hypothetical protein [Planctomycetota bacterium]